MSPLRATCGKSLVGASDDDCIQTRQVLAELILDHQHAAGRCAGHKCRRRIAGREHADILKMKTVDIFFRHDGLRNGQFVKLVRQWQLNQNAVDRRIGVEISNQREYLVLGGVGRKRVLHGVKSTRFSRTFLVSDVDLAGRVLTNDNDRKAGAQAITGGEIGRGLCNCCGYLGSHCLAVD
jgi:hypothetical protein